MPYAQKRISVLRPLLVEIPLEEGHISADVEETDEASGPGARSTRFVSVQTLSHIVYARLEQAVVRPLRPVRKFVCLISLISLFSSVHILRRSVSHCVATALLFASSDSYTAFGNCSQIQSPWGTQMSTSTR